jgi:hypothetical protein
LNDDMPPEYRLVCTDENPPVQRQLKNDDALDYLDKVSELSARTTRSPRHRVTSLGLGLV